MKAVLSLGRLIVTYLALTALTLDPRNPRSISSRPPQIADAVTGKRFDDVAAAMEVRHDR